MASPCLIGLGGAVATRMPIRPLIGRPGQSVLMLHAWAIVGLSRDCPSRHFLPALEAQHTLLW
jgi:hypothetical protein